LLDEYLPNLVLLFLLHFLSLILLKAGFVVVLLLWSFWSCRTNSQKYSRLAAVTSLHYFSI
ncbi:MAG: hypothetical protein ACK4Y3_06120, partial [Dolichospermum sp.]